MSRIPAFRCELSRRDLHRWHIVCDDGVLIKPLEEIPCPFCRTEEFIRYDPFNKEYSMDSEEDIRDWYMSYINEMRNKYGGK